MNGATTPDSYRIQVYQTLLTVWSIFLVGFFFQSLFATTHAHRHRSSGALFFAAGAAIFFSATIPVADLSKLNQLRSTRTEFDVESLKNGLRGSGFTSRIAQTQRVAVIPCASLQSEFIVPLRSKRC